MDFTQKKKLNSNEKNFHTENIKISREFSKEIILEMKELIRSIVIFGSNSKNTQDKNSDIDIMVVLDNVSLYVSDELKEAYRVILKNLISKHSNKLHILTMNLTDLWDMARKGDPVLINILRSGIPLFDRDLIEPMQYLLEIGKIRPTKEAIYNYSSRSKTLITETKKHIENAILDLYYSTTDIVHACLMSKNIMPPSPKEMPKIFKNTYSKTNLKKIGEDIEEIYNLSKKIEHNQEIKIDGKLYDKYLKKTQKIIFELNREIEQNIKKNKFEI